MVMSPDLTPGAETVIVYASSVSSTDGCSQVRREPRLRAHATSDMIASASTKCGMGMWASVCSRGCSLTLTRAPLPQEFVPKEERGLVNGFQQAIQSLFTMGVFLLGMIDHRCESE